MTTTTMATSPGPEDEPAGPGEVVDLGGARERHRGASEPAVSAETGDSGEGDGAEPEPAEAETAEAVGGDRSEPVPVDPPDTGAGPGLLELARTAERRPVLPAWARSRSQFRAAAGWVAGYYAYLAGFHAVRVPVYAARLAGRCPRGAYRVAGGFFRWWADTEGLPVRLAAVRREDPEQYIRLAR